MQPTLSMYGSEITCGTNQYSVFGSEEFVTYNWSVPTGATFTQEDNFIFVTWNGVSGSISCTATNFCGTTATASKVVNGCCTAGTTLNNVTLSAGTTTYNTAKSINGVLTIPSGASLIINGGATMSMGENARIEILDGGSLKVSNATLNGCNKMWQGIKANSGASIIIESNANIRDAIQALDAEGTASVHITQSTFNKNRN
jgi:hypothetical protein